MIYDTRHARPRSMNLTCSGLVPIVTATQGRKSPPASQTPGHRNDGAALHGQDLVAWAVEIVLQGGDHARSEWMLPQAHSFRVVVLKYKSEGSL